MRVGVGLLTYEAGMPGGPAGWPEAYRAATEFVLVAEALGFEHVWVSEHHLWYTGYCPAAVVASAALLARTSTIGVATGIVNASVRTRAELAASAHQLSVDSAGRFELGIGRGYRVVETTTAGGRDRRALARAVPDFLAEWGRLRPRTPLWVAATSRTAVRRAAAAGHRLLLAPFADRERVRALAAEYRAAYVGPDPCVGVVRDCCPDADSARMAERMYREEIGGWWARDGKLLSEQGGADEALAATLGRVVTGTPEAISQRLAEDEADGVDYLALRVSFGGSARSDALRLLAEVPAVRSWLCG